MPTYQYVCTECGGQLEAVQKFTDDPLTVHEDCGGRLRKVFSPVGIVFKGSGFYRTDSRGSGRRGPRPRRRQRLEGRRLEGRRLEGRRLRRQRLEGQRVEGERVVFFLVRFCFVVLEVGWRLVLVDCQLVFR